MIIRYSLSKVRIGRLEHGIPVGVIHADISIHWQRSADLASEELARKIVACRRLVCVCVCM